MTFKSFFEATLRKANIKEHELKIIVYRLN